MSWIYALVCASLCLSACAGSRNIPLRETHDFVRTTDGSDAYFISLKNGDTFVTQSLQAHGDSLTFAKDGFESADTSVRRQEVAGIRYEKESRVVDRIVTTTACVFAGFLASAVVLFMAALQSGGLGGC